MILQLNWLFAPESHRCFSTSPPINLSPNLTELTTKIYPKFVPLLSPSVLVSVQPNLNYCNGFPNNLPVYSPAPSIHHIHNPHHFIVVCLKPFKVYMWIQIKWALSYPSNPAMFPAESVLSTQHCQACQVWGSFLLRNHPIVWTGNCLGPNGSFEYNLNWMEMRPNPFSKPFS